MIIPTLPPDGVLFIDSLMIKALELYRQDAENKLKARLFKIKDDYIREKYRDTNQKWVQEYEETFGESRFTKEYKQYNV